MSQWWTVPNHKVRVSKRAKQVTIKISTHNGLEVVVPTGFDKSTIPEISSLQGTLDREEHDPYATTG